MEFVFVVPRGELFPDCYPHGIIATDVNKDASSEYVSNFEAVVRERGFFVERAYAERNPAWKQVIPYTIVTRGDEVLLLRRLIGGGDARLHDKLSIGVGGHINPEDLDATADETSKHPDQKDSQNRPDPVAAGTKREIEEELEIHGTYALRTVGILNDETNPVGAVHVGWLQVLELEESGTAEIREHDILEGEFVTRDHLGSLLEEGANFETWSRLLVERLDDIIPQQLTATT
ncbi:MAG: putative NUDIX family phosphoesterase [Planctomycetota bacterium]|jgi:predicted NUDIX family phosphoesterase